MIRIANNFKIMIMNNLLKFGVLLLTLLILADYASAQTKEPATIYIYKPGKIIVGRGTVVNIDFFDVNVCRLKSKSKLKY